MLEVLCYGVQELTFLYLCPSLVHWKVVFKKLITLHFSMVDQKVKNMNLAADFM